VKIGGVLPSKYSGRWWGWPQFDFEKEKRNSPQPPSFLPACLGFAPKTFGRTDGGTENKREDKREITLAPPTRVRVMSKEIPKDSSIF